MSEDIRLDKFTTNEGLDGQELGRNPKQGSLAMGDPDDTGSPLTSAVAFDKKNGMLSWIKENGDILEASGFLTEAQAGRGPRGKKGKQGKKGKNAKPGRDGATGETGCGGSTGHTGDKGFDGEDAKSGEQGIPGNFGCPGVVGGDGEEGIKGGIGFQGSIGKKGISCIIGPVGDTGPTGSGNVAVTEIQPVEPETYLWLSVSDPIEEQAETLSGKVNDLTIRLYTKGNNEFQAEGIFVLSDFVGNTGPYEMYWTGDHLTDVKITDSQVSNNDKQLKITCTATLEPEQTTSITGFVYLNITDKGNAEVEPLKIKAKYTFIGENTEASLGPLYARVDDLVDVTEGNDINWIVQLNKLAPERTLVTWAIAAHAPATFADIDNQASGSGYIEAGQTSYTITVPAVADGILNEEKETFSVRATVGGAQEENPDDLLATCSIIDGDTPKTNFSMNSLTVTESDSNKTINVTLMLGGSIQSSGNAVGYTFSYRTVDSTALNGQDFVSVTGQKTFTSSFETITIPITLIGDTTNESTESFKFEVYDIGENITIASPILTVTINDDDSSSGGNPGGGGCVLFGQQVLTELGDVLVEYLQDGEQVTGCAITATILDDSPKGFYEEQMPDGSDSKMLSNWRADSITEEHPEVDVVRARHSKHYRYIDINEGMLKLTPDHPVLIYRDEWIWLPAGHIIVGDKMFSRDRDYVPVTSTLEVFETVDVVTLDVEPVDTYYVNGILVHNADGNQAKN